MHLNKNPANVHPLYSPRTAYKRIRDHDERMIADMTLNFDKLAINLLKEEFIKYGNQLTLSEFIYCAKKHLKFWQTDIPNRQKRLIRYLTHLFKEIDINGNGGMDWQQFTNYIIEKATVLKNLKTKKEQIKQYIRSDINPKIRIDGLIQKTQYIQDIDKVVFFEQGSNIIWLMNVQNGQILPKTLVIHPRKLVVNISSVKKQKSGKVSIKKKDLVLPTSIRILDMLYLNEKKYKILLVSTSDGLVRGWKYSQSGFVLANQPENDQQLFQHHFSSEIYCMAWDNINEVLYCGMKNGNIVQWNLKTDLERALIEDCVCQSIDEKINSLITVMLTMPKLQFMASGRMDGKLILWDTINSKRKWVYSEHTRGILSLSYNQSMILLFSAGFDHKICIWNPYISSLIHKIQGHLSPIVTLNVIDGTNQLISMDSQGIVKITDTKRFNIISSFSVEQNQSFMTINKPSKQILKLIFSGKSIQIYDYDKNYNPYTADENTVVCCRYVKNLLCFFTPAGKKIKVWSALTGDIQKIYIDIVGNEITCFDFDSLAKRMILGDMKGNIGLYNATNGAKMKVLTKHNGQVTHIITIGMPDSSDMFISCGTDNEIRITRQTQQSYEVLRTIYLKKDIDILCIQYCNAAKLIVVGTNMGTLCLFDLQTGKNVGGCTVDSGDQFTSICKAEGDFIIVTTSSGLITLIGIPPSPSRFERLMNYGHRDCQKQNAQLGIRLSAYNEQKKLLFVIDDKMYLSCYSLADIVKGLQQCDFAKQKLEFERKSLLRAIFRKTSIKLKWQVKAHTETVKTLHYVQKQNIVITSSFDKKVKIWDSNSGSYLVSLQQNYNKEEAKPLGYYDHKRNIIYNQDKKIVAQDAYIDPHTIHSDPFVTEMFSHHFNQASNNQWKLEIDFKSIVQQAQEEFQTIALELQQKNQEENQLKNSQKKCKDIETDEQMEQFTETQRKKQIKKQIVVWKKQILEKKKKIMQEIRKQNHNSQPILKMPLVQRSRKISNNYFRRSMMKCIQNVVDKTNGSNLMNQIAKKPIRPDYIPIYETVRKKQRTKEEILNHKQFICNLFKKQTQNMINGKKSKQIMLSKQEAKATQKLFRLLNDKNQTNQTMRFGTKENQQHPRTSMTATRQKSPFYSLQKSLPS